MPWVSDSDDDALRWTVPVRLRGQWERRASFSVATVVRTAVATVSRLALDHEEYRVDQHGPRRWVITHAGATLTLDVDVDDDRSALLSLRSLPASARSTVPDNWAIVRDLITAGLGSIASSPGVGEEAASDDGLAVAAAAPVVADPAERSAVTVVRTCLTVADLRECLVLVPFRRRSAPSRVPMVFTLGESGHLATQQVNVTFVDESDLSTTVLLSWQVTSSGSAVTDAVAVQRARVCIDALCGSITEWDPDALRDDERSVIR